MEHRAVGSSGIEISRIGLGGYQLGPEPDEAPDVDRAVQVIESAISSGVNWLDTSENYLATRNESVIGCALDRIDDGFLIASKVAPGAGVTGGGSGFQREQVLQACRDSLRRLGREHLDIYFLHWPDDAGVPLEETWGAMAELADDGLVRAIGLSNYSLEDVERCHATRTVDAVQVGLNLIDYLDDRLYVADAVTSGSRQRSTSLSRAGYSAARRWSKFRPPGQAPGESPPSTSACSVQAPPNEASQSRMDCARSRRRSAQPSHKWRSRGCYTSLG